MSDPCKCQFSGRIVDGRTDLTPCECCGADRQSMCSHPMTPEAEEKFLLHVLIVINALGPTDPPPPKAVLNFVSNSAKRILARRSN